MNKVDLPRPQVDVTPAIERDSNAESGSLDIVISRGGQAKSYRTKGGTVPEVVKDGIEKILNDRHTGEWLP